MLVDINNCYLHFQGENNSINVEKRQDSNLQSLVKFLKRVRLEGHNYRASNDCDERGKGTLIGRVGLRRTPGRRADVH